MTAAKAAESLFRPALKRRGYQAPEFFRVVLSDPMEDSDGNARFWVPVPTVAQFNELLESFSR